MPQTAPYSGSVVGMRTSSDAYLLEGPTSTPVQDEGLEVGGEASGWQFEVTPYAWLLGIEGDAEVNGNSVDFERSFSDLIDSVDLAGSILGTAQYGRFVGWLQYDYAVLNTSDFDVSGEFDSTMHLLEVAVGYQVDGWSEGQTFDILFGLRHLDLESDLDIDGLGEFSSSVSLTDPMLVIRPMMPLFSDSIDGLTLSPTFGIGGGGDSDFIYELQPQIHYEISEGIGARFGYRTVAYEFEQDGDELNIQLTGLIIGLSFQF